MTTSTITPVRAHRLHSDKQGQFIVDISEHLGRDVSFESADSAVAFLIDNAPSGDYVLLSAGEYVDTITIS